MNPTMQSALIVLIVLAAAAYLLRTAWRGYARALRTRRLAERERLCDPECGCGH